jgi:hypothetical protein
MDSSPYAPPQAELSNQAAPLPKYVSVWLAIVLTFVTLGLYMPYWTLTRSRDLNNAAQAKMVNYNFAWFVALFFVVSYVLGFCVEYFEIMQGQRTIINVTSNLSNILMLIWNINFRSGLNKFTGAEKGTRLWSNLFYTWFFQMYYHQYKINQIIKDNEPAATN